MATDANNLKLNKVTAATKAAFAEAVISNGSVYWDETTKSLVVGDGVTKGGIPQSGSTQLEALKTELNTSINAKLATSELETALKELIVEFGGTVPTE